MKRCTKCGETKALADFHNDKSREDGKFPQCVKCCKLYLSRNKPKRAKYLEKTKDRRKYLARIYYEKHIEDKRKYKVLHREKNSEKIKFKSSEYYKRNVDILHACVIINRLGLKKGQVPSDVFENITRLVAFRRELKKLKEAK